MKTTKIILILVCALVCSVAASGQLWFDMGLKAGFGPTILYNKNIFDDRTYDHELTSGFAFGGKLGANFADHHAFTLDYISSKSRQDFEFEYMGVNGARNEFEWDHSDILFMYRYTGNGAYVEIGPKFSSVKEVRQQFMTVIDSDVSNFFRDNYTSVVFGFGSFLMGSDLFTVQVGVRLHYALDDFIEEDGQALAYPAQPRVYPEYKETRATAAQFSLEFNYAFGRFARAACSHRWKLILFE